MTGTSGVSVLSGCSSGVTFSVVISVGFSVLVGSLAMVSCNLAVVWCDSEAATQNVSNKGHARPDYQAKTPADQK
jgi:hypothetical protein